MLQVTRARLVRQLTPLVVLAAAVVATEAGAATQTKDRTPPTVAITAPTAGPVAGAVVVAAVAKDNVAVSNVRFYVDGVQLGSQDASAPYGRNWNTAVASSGRHVLTAVARDTNGNTATSAAVQVSVGDVTPPTVTLTAPGDGSTVSGMVAVTASASDDVGVAGVTFAVDGVALGIEQTAAPYRTTWDTTAISNTPHTVVVTARDAMGHTSTASASVVVSNTPPPPPPPPPPTAAQRFMAPNGNDSGDCSSSASPCATFDYAYHQAQPGETVQVASGTYSRAIATGDVILNYDASKAGAAPTTFLALGTVTVDLQSTTTINHSPDFRGAQNVVFDGVNFLHGSIGIIPQFGSGCGANSDGVTLQNLSLNGAISIRNAQNVLVENVSIGGFTYPDAGVQDAWGDSTRVGDYDCGARASHVTFDHVRWHDIFRGSSPSHAECLFIERSDYVSVTNSRLEACPVMGIFLKNDGGVSDGSNYQDHVLIENNFISQPCPSGGSATSAECGSRGIQESNCDNNAGVAAPSSPLQWTIRFNSLGPDAEIWICEPASYWSASSVLQGNIASSLLTGTNGNGSCTAGVKPAELANWNVGYDVWTGASQQTCSATDTQASAASEFMSPATFDFHLLPAVTALVPFAQGCPATDIDGDPRPGATAGYCFAGADERP